MGNPHGLLIVAGPDSPGLEAADGGERGQPVCKYYKAVELRFVRLPAARRQSRAEVAASTG